MNGKISFFFFFFLKSRWEACSQPKCAYSQTQSSALVQVHRMQAVPLIFLHKKAEAVMKWKRCKNRNDFAGQSIENEWHVHFADTSVQILQKLKTFMSETRHEHELFSDRIIFASMFNDISSWENQGMQSKCQAEAKEVATYAARCGPDNCFFCGPRSDKTWTKNEYRPSHPCVDGE